MSTQFPQDTEYSSEKEWKGGQREKEEGNTREKEIHRKEIVSLARVVSMRRSNRRMRLHAK